MRRIGLPAFWFALLVGCAGPQSVPAAVAATEFVSDHAGSPTPSGIPQSTAASHPPSATALPGPSPTATVAPASEDVELAFVGDIMLGRSLGKRIAAGDGGTIFASVEPLLQAADLAVGNLECAIGEGGTPEPKAYTFLAPPPSAVLLRSAGFDLLSLANNHSLDYGVDVFRQTLGLLAENGVRTVGAGADDREARRPAIFDIRGLKIALLAYVEVPKEYTTQFDTRRWEAGPGKPGIAWAEDRLIRSDLEALAADPSPRVTVVLFHFGIEGTDIPDSRQVQLAHLAVDSGADLVVGSHSHTIQGDEEYNRGRIFYSLGNFVFDGFEGESNRSVILWITVSASRTISARRIPLSIVDGMPRMGE
jgi:poly-gamma-glutamate capsule biosynthesis protein CapA/YwtB (metallophosphatase superfamily)